MKKIVEKIWNMLNEIKVIGCIYMKKLINKFWSIIDKIAEDEHEPSKDDYVCVQVINIYKI